ncbi:Cysteine/Histidine-rich C1 domain family protein [Hibiscus syriacus]|uniref:Cysteine/Histidine-rich C1 domain family protein n=1 Tax=Hibiscus syriacus TaxID=106335 RepID=A0A6A3BRG1_HIBSY|nr:Cysteine/Histidine-rich C1 domain family protein [Hibiscus syriacus]
MGLNGIKATCVTYENLINGYCKIADIYSAMLIYRDMRRKDFRPHSLTVKLLIRGLCGKGMMEEVIKLHAEMAGKGFKPILEIYDAFIDGYLRQGNEEMAAMLRKEALETQKEEVIRCLSSYKWKQTCLKTYGKLFLRYALPLLDNDCLSFVEIHFG